jgi:hypothetical protein
MVPYKSFNLVQNALEWGHAHMDLDLPPRMPDLNSGIPTNYWELYAANNQVPVSFEDFIKLGKGNLTSNNIMPLKPEELTPNN